MTKILRSRTVAQAVVLALIAVQVPAAFADEHGLQWREDDAYGLVVEFIGSHLASPRQFRLSARIGSCSAADSIPPMMAEVEVLERGLRLRPKFPLDPAGTYCALLESKRESVGRQSVGRQSAEWDGTTKSKNITVAEVVKVLPAVPHLPANALRLYVEFSRPVFAKNVHRWVRLRDETDERWIDTPFVEIPEGLWDPHGRQLTLIFHPGRIKRGVGPNLAMGPPLIPGHAYTLVVERSGSDRYEHHFIATEPDRSAIDPSRWRIVEPSVAGAPWRVDFRESLDPYLAERWIRLAAGSPAESIPGEVAPAGDHLLIEGPNEQNEIALWVHRDLEDLAGNRVHEVFDRPTLGTAEESEVGTQQTQLASSPWLRFSLRATR